MASKKPPPKGAHQVTCPCGKTFTATRPHAKYCHPTHRVRGHRSGDEAAPVISLTSKRIAVVDSRDLRAGSDLEESEDATADRDDRDRHPLVRSVIETLRQADRLETWQGQAAVELARAGTSSMDTGSSKTAVMRGLKEAMAEAMRGVGAGDAVNELEERMARKLAGGGGA